MRVRIVNSMAARDPEVRRCKVLALRKPQLFGGSKEEFVQCDLVLTECRILYRKDEEILLEDLLGVHVSKEPVATDPIACRVTVDSFPLFRENRKPSRRFCQAVLLFKPASTFRDNLYTALDWKKAIDVQCRQWMRTLFVSDSPTCKLNSGRHTGYKL